MKCVGNMSVQLFLTELWQFSEASTDSFLTHLGLLTHFRDISKYDLTDFWHSFATDRFMTDIWHILDSFLTDFCNWQFSVTYQTHFWNLWDPHQPRVPDFLTHFWVKISQALVSLSQAWLKPKNWTQIYSNLSGYKKEAFPDPFRLAIPGSYIEATRVPFNGLGLGDTLLRRIVKLSYLEPQRTKKP